jgi:protein ECT2
MSEADARKEEMRQLISLRQAESPFRRQMQGSSTPQKHINARMKDTFPLQEWTATVEVLVGQSERELKRASANQELLHTDLKELSTEFSEVSK